MFFLIHLKEENRKTLYCIEFLQVTPKRLEKLPDQIYNLP